MSEETLAMRLFVMASKKRSQVKLFKFLIKLAPAIVLFYLISSQVNISEIKDLLRNINIDNFMLSVSLMLSAVLLNGVRWHLITKGIKATLSITNASISSLEAMFFNQLLPTGVGGDAIRIWRSHETGIRWIKAFTGVAIDRAFGLFTVALIVVINSSTLHNSAPFDVLFYAAVIVLIGATVGLLFAIWFPTKWFPTKLAILETLFSDYKQCATNLTSFIILLAISVTSNLLVAWSFAFAAAAIELHLDWKQAIIVVQALALAAVIPASIGGWGVREMATIIILGEAGIGATQATAASIVYGSVLTTVGVFGAIVWLLRRDQSTSRLSDKNAISIIERPEAR